VQIRPRWHSRKRGPGHEEGQGHPAPIETPGGRKAVSVRGKVKPLQGTLRGQTSTFTVISKNRGNKGKATPGVKDPGGELSKEYRGSQNVSDRRVGTRKSNKPGNKGVAKSKNLKKGALTMENKRKGGR